MATESSDDFAARIVGFFRKHRRDLPWRPARDPYATWVSEIMLQQTRVSTVIPYFQRWMEKFPTIVDLAEADSDEVLALWSGLGYYSRARNLQKGAREVVARYGGALPRDAEALQQITGIGRYTAGAIASIALGQRAALVDGNVARVLARVLLIEDDVKSTSGLKKLWNAADELVPSVDPGHYNEGLMELGATVCTPRRPRCDACPVATLCGAHKSQRVSELPVVKARLKKDQKKLLVRHAIWSLKNGRLLLGRRNPHGLYGGLWELPQAETLSIAIDLVGLTTSVVGSMPCFARSQELSHRRLEIDVWACECRGRLNRTGGGDYAQFAWQPLKSVEECGISAATRAIIENYRERPGWKTSTLQPASSKKDTKRSSKA